MDDENKCLVEINKFNSCNKQNKTGKWTLTSGKWALT